MSWLKGNKIVLHGSENTILQNIENSTININNSESIEKLLKEFKEYSHECLNIFVISSAKEWKPFSELSIIDIITKATETLKSSTIVWSVDSLEETNNEKFWATLKYLKQKSILIVDGLSLNTSGNKQIARIFNDYHVGGCLAVSSNSNDFRKEHSEELINKTFNHLSIYLNDYAGTLPNMHLKTRNINKESELINEILNISKYFLQIHTIKSMNRLNLGYNQTML